MKDETLERIWEARRQIYSQCGNDPQQLVAYYMERQKTNQSRLVYINHSTLQKKVG